MSKGIILFQSKYGATKKYADWLAEMTGYDCAETKNANAVDLKPYDVILLGGGVYASGIAGFQFIKKNIGQLADKKIAVFAVGASPYDEKAILQMRDLHFKNELRSIPLFYCRGAWDEETMKFTDRALCKMLQKAVAKQNPDEYEPWQKALMCTVCQHLNCRVNIFFITIHDLCIQNHIVYSLACCKLRAIPVYNITSFKWNRSTLILLLI